MRPGAAVIRCRLAAILAAGLALAGLARPSAAGGPELVLGAGRTLAVEGVPGGGGISLGLSLLWPLERHFRVGLMGFAEALGEETARLIGPSGEDLGPVAGVHRAAQGAAVRLEAHLPGDRWLSPYLAATWGLYRIEDEVRGAALGSDAAAGFGLGAGLQRRFNPHHAAGVALRAQQLSRSGAGRYLSAALEWRWSTGAGE